MKANYKSEWVYKNRYGVEYWFNDFNGTAYQFTIKDDGKYWRWAPSEKIPYTYEFIDPPGGPFLEVGMCIDNREVKSITCSTDGPVFLEVGDSNDNDCVH